MRAWNHGPHATFYVDMAYEAHIRAPNGSSLCGDDGPQQRIALPLRKQEVCVECLRALVWFPQGL